MVKRNLWITSFSSITGIDSLEVMWNSVNILKDKYLKEVWRNLLGVVLWTIWLDRNHCIFNKMLTSSNNLMLILKFRSSQWNVAANLIASEASTSWDQNPIGCVTRTQLVQFQRLMDNGHSHTAFIDGSWKRLTNGSVLAGIGGVIKDSSGKFCLNFAGPVQVLDVFQSEVEALKFVIKIFEEIGGCNDSLLIYSDNAHLIEQIKGSKFDQVTKVDQISTLDLEYQIFRWDVKKLSES